MSKILKGTVATRTRPGKCPITSPLKVLRQYLQWAETPTSWGMHRANELAVSIAWALSNIDVKTKQKQERLEAKSIPCGTERSEK